jgi:hypothetical protein
VASDPAVATALALFGECFPTRPVTAATLSAFSLVLRHVSDADLERATGALCSQPGRTFFPTPAEVLLAATPPAPPVDVDRLASMIYYLGTPTPHGTRPPSHGTITRYFGTAIANAVATVGLTRLVAGSEQDAQWAKKELAAALSDLPHPEVPETVPRLGGPRLTLKDIEYFGLPNPDAPPHVDVRAHLASIGRPLAQTHDPR